MNAPVALIAVPATRVPFGTSSRVVTLAPEPSFAAGGVAPSAPVVPLMPDTSMRRSRAVMTTSGAAPMNAPVEALSRP